MGKPAADAASHTDILRVFSRLAATVASFWGARTFREVECTLDKSLENTAAPVPSGVVKPKPR